MAPEAQDQTKRIAVHIGHHIRVARQMRNLTQAELGERINLTFQQVQKYEYGSSRISAPTLFLIAEALAVPIDFFFKGLPLNIADGNANGATPSGDGWKIAALFSGITRAGLRRRLMSIAHEVAGIDAELNNRVK